MQLLLLQVAQLCGPLLLPDCLITVWVGRCLAGGREGVWGRRNSCCVRGLLRAALLAMQLLGAQD